MITEWEMKYHVANKVASDLSRGCAGLQGERDQLRAEVERLKQEQAEPVPQFRKVGCADWYDGFPDHSDGGGPYEVRTLYAAPQGQTALLRQALEALDGVAQWVNKRPDTHPWDAWRICDSV